MALPRLRICAQLAHRYSYTGNNNQTLSKEVLLNDTDPLYKRLKHMHIAELSTQLHAEYKALLQSSRTLTLTVTHPHPNPDPDPDPNPDPNPGPSPEQAFLESNKSSAALSKGNANDVRAMAEGLKAMPKFQVRARDKG